MQSTQMVKQTKILFCTLAGVLLLGSGYLEWVSGHMYLAVGTLILSSIILLNGALTAWARQPRFIPYTEWLFIGLLVVFSIIAARLEDNGQFYWLFFIPIAAFFLLSLRHAIIFTLCLIPLVFFLVLRYAPILLQAQILYSVAAIWTVSLFLAMVKARTHDLLAPLISTDDETQAQLGSRLFADLQKEIVRAEREGTGLLLMIMDLDLALKNESSDKKHSYYISCSKSIAIHLREFDLHYRLDKYRFAIVLPHITTQEALLIAKEMVDDMPEHLRKNIMVGYASLNVGDHAQSLIQQAQQELSHV